MRPSYRALLCAIFLLALFTLDSKALSRVEQRGGYRPANVTSLTQHQPQKRQWQPQQQQSPYGQQPSYATTTPGPSQQWNTNAGAGWNSNAGQGGNKNWNTYNQTANPWQQQQRYNNTPGVGGQYPNWNAQQRPFQNQSHLYPQLPVQNAGGRQPLQPLPTPARFNNQWNQTRLPSQQYPGGVMTPNQNNWYQNKTWAAVQTTTPLPYYRPTNNNWWNHTRGNNNPPAAGTVTGWGSPSGTAVVSNGSNPNYPQGQAGTTWAGWGQNNPGTTGWNGAQNNPAAGWGSTAGQNSWQSGSGGAGVHNGLNSNNNWPTNNGPSSSGGNGVQLAPIGGAGGQQQPYAPSNSGGIPLAPIGGGSNSQPGWHSASSQQNPNAWNHGSSGSAQLAPLAPLSYGSGGGGGASAVDSNRAHGGGGSNPYSNMFN